MENSDNKKVTTRTLIIRVIMVVVLLIVAFIGYKKVSNAMTHETTDNAQIEGRLVPILPRVSGYIKKIYADDYTEVTKDSLIAELDDAELQLQLEEMNADLAQVQPDIDNARANIENAKALLASTKANQSVIQTRKEKAMRDFQRDQNLLADSAITARQADDTKSNLDVTNKQLDATSRDLQVAETRITVLESQLRKAEAQIAVKKAKIDEQKLKISYTKIYATADGKIGKRNVDIGQFVQAGSPLFTIVNDKNFWIVANFKENQIKYLAVGKEAEISVDGYPDAKIKGTITAISDATGAKFALLPPDNSTGNFVKVTQRVPVKIEIEDAGKYKDMLRAGLSLDVSVKH